MPPRQTSSIHEHVRIKCWGSVAGVRGQRVLRGGSGRRPAGLIPPVNCVIGKGKTAEIRDPGRGWRRLALALEAKRARSQRQKNRPPEQDFPTERSFLSVAFTFIEMVSGQRSQREQQKVCVAIYLAAEKEKLLKYPEILTGMPASPRYAENTFSCIFVARKLNCHCSKRSFFHSIRMPIVKCENPHGSGENKHLRDAF